MANDVADDAMPWEQQSKIYISQRVGGRYGRPKKPVIAAETTMRNGEGEVLFCAQCLVFGSDSHRRRVAYSLWVCSVGMGAIARCRRETRLFPPNREGFALFKFSDRGRTQTH